MSYCSKRSSLSGQNGCMVWKKWIQFLYRGVFMMEVRLRLFPVSCTDLVMQAYSAVIYMVYETPRGIFTRLLCSKTSVAPL